MEIQKINRKQTKATVDGIKYRAKPHTADGVTGCEGCAFAFPCVLGGGPEGQCIPSMRNDDQHIIWVKRKKQEQA